MKKIRKLVKEQSGSLYILTLIFLFLIVFTMLIFTEVLRVHDLKEHLDDEIYRASNLAIKTAMLDSYRIDSRSKFDEQVAIDYFYSYLKKDLELNSKGEQYQSNGDLVYNLVINEIYVNGDTVRMNIKATAYAKPLFNLWDNKWVIPLDILSRNIRTD